MAGFWAITLSEELADSVQEFARALQVHGMPGIGDNGEFGVRNANAHLPGNPDKLAIESAGDQQDRHIDLVKPVPVRWLRALAHAAKTVDQPNDAIAKTNLALELEYVSR